MCLMFGRGIHETFNTMRSCERDMSPCPETQAAMEEYYPNATPRKNYVFAVNYEIVSCLPVLC